MRGSKLNNRNYNVKYKLPGQLNQPRGPTPPPVDPKYPPERAEDEEEGSSQKTGQYWYYSDHAGGMVLPYRKHYGEKMHSVPLSYLKWCYNKLTYATTFRRAFERYYDGLRQWVMDGNYGEIVVPVGHTYRGMKLKNCRDKQWMVWLRKWTRQYRPKDLDKHDIFFLAVDEWVKHPRHQDAIRDIGELLARTEYEDDMDLQEGEEYVDEDADELDEEGNLKHFIEVVDEPDSNEDYTDSEGSSSSGASDADEESAEETEDSEDEMHSVFPTPPPETPKKRRRREVSSEEELESELEFVAQSPSDSKPRSVSLRSGKLVTFGDCVAEVLPTPPPDSSRKRPRLDTPGECGPSHLSQGDCSPLSEKTRANPQMRLPITPKTPTGKYKRPHHNVVINSEDDEEDDDDDIPLDQLFKTPSKSLPRSQTSTPSKGQKYSKAGFNGSRQYKCPDNGVVATSDDDDVPLDQLLKTPSKASSSPSAPLTPSKPKYSKPSLNGSPMKQLARKLFN